MPNTIATLSRKGRESQTFAPLLSAGEGFGTEGAAARIGPGLRRGGI